MSRPDAIPFNCVCCTVFMGVIKSCLEKVYDMLAPVSKSKVIGGGDTEYPWCWCRRNWLVKHERSLKGDCHWYCPVLGTKVKSLAFRGMDKVGGLVRRNSCAALL